MDFCEIISEWLKTNCTNWQVWYGAFIEIGFKDNMKRWTCMSHIYLTQNEIHVYETNKRIRKNAVLVHSPNYAPDYLKYSLNACDPNLFSKLKEILTEYEKVP
jgi:hypothetical protein